MFYQPRRRFPRPWLRIHSLSINLRKTNRILPKSELHFLRRSKSYVHIERGGGDCFPTPVSKSGLMNDCRRRQLFSLFVSHEVYNYSICFSISKNPEAIFLFFGTTPSRRCAYMYNTYGCAEYRSIQS